MKASPAASGLALLLATTTSYCATTTGFQSPASSSSPLHLHRAGGHAILLKTRGGGGSPTAPPSTGVIASPASSRTTTTTALEALSDPKTAINNATDVTTTSVTMTATTTEEQPKQETSPNGAQQQQSAAAAAAASWIQQQQQQIDATALRTRLEKCAAVWGATAVTVLLRQHAGLSAVAASSWTGLVAALTATAPAAAFCGSFAGMSAHAANLPQAAQLGACAAAVFYWWDARAVGVGKGGRLGTIALGGNLLYAGLGSLLPLAAGTVQILSPLTAIVMAIAALALKFARSTPVHDDKQSSASNNDNDNDNGDDSKYSATQRDPANRRRLAQLSKAVVLAAAAARLFAGTPSTSAATVLKSLLSAVAAAIAVQKSRGVVLPVALVGLLGSHLAPPALAAPIYLGGFVGMTGLPNFQWSNTVQACTLATLLLHLGVLDGFGGKLGFLSFVGVLFGM